MSDEDAYRSIEFFAEQARQCRARARDRTFDLSVRRNLMQLARHYEKEAQRARAALARGRKNSGR